VLLRQARTDTISLGLRPGDTLSRPSLINALMCVHISGPRAGMVCRFFVLPMWTVRRRRSALSHALDSLGARAPSRCFEISAEIFARPSPVVACAALRALLSLLVRAT